MKIVIVGCGRITKERHAPECVAHPDVELRGFYDLVPQRAEAFCREYGGRVYTDYETVCSDPEVDAVILCNPNRDHAAFSVRALEAGKAVLCEKPVATSLEEAEWIGRTARETGGFFMVAHNQRFDCVNKKLKEILHSGRMGKVLTFEAQFAHGGPEYWSVDAQKTMYFQKEKNGLGVLGDLAVHKIDLMRWLLDTEFDRVQAQCATLDKKTEEGAKIPLEDNAVLLVHTQNGQLGTITASWTHYAGCASEVTLRCEKGVARAWDTSSSGEHAILLQMHNGDRERYDFAKRGTSGVLDAFVEAFSCGQGSPVSAQEGVRDMEVIRAALECAAE